MKGIVTDFKRFAIHDGDGIRTTVFLKGCPLRCVWCHNPESIAPRPQLAFYAEKCVGCGACVRACPQVAHKLENGVHTLDRNSCVSCGMCAEVCYAGALHLYGKEMTVEEVIRIVAEDKIFYTNGGGMTLSGGEPTRQRDFALALLLAAKGEGINTALDTCGMTAWETFAAMLPYVDTFLYDVKHITEAGHLRCTGRSNWKILDNLRRLSGAGARVEIRMPLFPGHNDDTETLHGVGALLSGVRITKMRLLPYNDCAHSKYASLSLPDTMPKVPLPDRSHVESCAEILRGYGIKVITE